MKEKLKFREVFVWTLTCILWAICMFSFRFQYSNTFIMTLLKSTGIAFGFCFVCYACDEDTWKEEKITTPPPEIETEEKDLWLEAYEAKYGPIEKRETKITETPSGAVCVGSSAIAIGRDAYIVGSESIAFTPGVNAKVILHPCDAEEGDVRYNEDLRITEYFHDGKWIPIVMKEECIPTGKGFYEENTSIYHGSCYNDSEGRRFCYDSKKSEYIRIS